MLPAPIESLTNDRLAYLRASFFLRRSTRTYNAISAGTTSRAQSNCGQRNNMTTCSGDPGSGDLVRGRRSHQSHARAVGSVCSSTKLIVRDADIPDPAKEINHDNAPGSASVPSDAEGGISVDRYVEIPRLRLGMTKG